MSDADSPVAAIESPRLQRWRDGILVGFVVLLVFGIVVIGQFSSLDDLTMLVQNERYAEPTFSNFIKHFTDPQFNIFAPLTYGLWHVIWVGINAWTDPTSPISPVPFKVVSVLVHVLTAVAVWDVLGFILKNRWACVLGALVFALHPVQVESVSWTTGLKDELCGLFSFLAIGAYFRFIDTGGARLRWRVVIFIVLASLSKPTAVMLPVALFAIEIYRRRPANVILPSIVPLIIPGVISAAIMMHIQTPTNLYSPLWARPLIVADTIAFYLYKIALPFQLVPDYTRAPDVIIRNGQIFWTWIIPAILFAIVWKWGSRRVILATALFFIPLFPISGIVRFDMQQYSTVADHYLYQPMLAFGLLAGIVCEWGIKWRVVIGGWLVVLATLALMQIILRLDDFKLFEYNARVYPDSVMTMSGQARYAIQRRDYVKAEEIARKCIDIRHRALEYDTLSRALFGQMRFEESADAIKAAIAKGLNDAQILDRMLKRAALMGDRGLAEIVAKHWLRIEPKNQLTRKKLDRIVASKSSTQPTTRATADQIEALESIP